MMDPLYIKGLRKAKTQGERDARTLTPEELKEKRGCWLSVKSAKRRRW